MQFKNFSLSTVAGLTFGLLLVGYTVLAWSPPTSSPPNNNASAPINTSSTAQTKAGALTLQDDFISQNKTLWGDDIKLGRNDTKGISQCGDIILNDNAFSPIQKVAFHACDVVVGTFRGIVGLFDSTGTQQIVLNPDNKTIAVDTVTVKGDGTISTNLNANKLEDLHAADLMAAGGGGGGPTDFYNYIYFYYSQNTHDGNLGGLAGANTICGSEKPAGVPSGLTYKAYLCSGATCQKPLAGANTVVVGASRYAVLDNYKIINLFKSPDAASSTEGKWNALKNGLSGITSAFPYNYLYNFLSELSAMRFWSGASSTVQYTNAYNQNVYDASSSTDDCSGWTRTSGYTAYYGSGGPFGNVSWVRDNLDGCVDVYRLLCFAQ